jgi:hypothetical protein
VTGGVEDESLLPRKVIDNPYGKLKREKEREKRERVSVTRNSGSTTF